MKTKQSLTDERRRLCDAWNKEHPNGYPQLPSVNIPQPVEVEIDEIEDDEGAK